MGLSSLTAALSAKTSARAQVWGGAELWGDSWQWWHFVLAGPASYIVVIAIVAMLLPHRANTAGAVFIALVILDHS
jgi:hypothetical protein